MLRSISINVDIIFHIVWVWRADWRLDFFQFLITLITNYSYSRIIFDYFSVFVGAKGVSHIDNVQVIAFAYFMHSFSNDKPVVLIYKLPTIPE